MALIRALYRGGGRLANNQDVARRSCDDLLGHTTEDQARQAWLCPRSDHQQDGVQRLGRPHDGGGRRFLDHQGLGRQIDPGHQLAQPFLGGANQFVAGLAGDDQRCADRGIPERRGADGIQAVKQGQPGAHAGGLDRGDAHHLGGAVQQIDRRQHPHSRSWHQRLAHDQHRTGRFAHDAGGGPPQQRLAQGNVVASLVGPGRTGPITTRSAAISPARQTITSDGTPPSISNRELRASRPVSWATRASSASPTVRASRSRSITAWDAPAGDIGAPGKSSGSTCRKVSGGPASEPPAIRCASTTGASADRSTPQRMLRKLPSPTITGSCGRAAGRSTRGSPLHGGCVQRLAFRVTARPCSVRAGAP